MNAKGKSVFDMLDEVAQAENSDGSLKLALDDIRNDGEQPREKFEQERLDNLAKSIAKFGVIQPITVRNTGGVPPYEIITGERRFRAAKIAGLTEIPAVVRDDWNEDNESRGIVQLVENSNRADLSDYETAKFIQRLIDRSPDPSKHGLKAEIAELLDRPRTDISRLLSMLDTDYIDLVHEGILTSADAMVRFRACEPDLQEALIADAREAGEPITSGMIRAAKKSFGKPAAAPARAPAADAAPGAPSSAVESNTPAGVASAAGQVGTPAGDSTGSADPSADAGDAGNDHGQVAGDGSLAGAADPGASLGPIGDDDNGGGNAGDDDDDDDDDAHHTGGGVLGTGTSTSSDDGEPSVRTGTASTANTMGARHKAVALTGVTGEYVEALLRALVDKASDKMEIRLPHDLAVAVIENLDGHVPDNPEHFAGYIKELLDAKLAD